MSRVRVIAMIIMVCLSLISRTGAEEQTLRIWGWFGGSGHPAAEGLKAAIAAEWQPLHPEVVIELRPDVTPDKLLVATLAGAGPDVARHWNDEEVIMWAAKGVLEPVDVWAARSKANLYTWVPPNVLQSWTYKGHVYGFPFALNLRGMLFYNLDLFAAAGIAAPPKSTVELALSARKLVRSTGERVTQLGFAPTGFGQQELWPGLYAAGGQLYDATTQRLTLDSPANIAYLEWERDVVQAQGAASNAATFLENFQTAIGADRQKDNPFLAQLLATYVNGSWWFDQLAATPNLNWGVTAMPRSPDYGNSRALLSSGPLLIMKGSKHPDLAWEFLRWFAERDIIRRYIYHGRFLATPPQAQQLIAELLLTAEVFPPIATVSSVISGFGSVRQKTMAGTAAALGLLEELCRTEQARLDEVGSQTAEFR